MRPNWARRVMLVLILLLFPEPRANAEDHATVIVFVYNNAKVPESVMAETGRHVREMFDKAGVELIWLDSMARLRAGQTEALGVAPAEVRAIRVSVVIIPRPDEIAPRLRNLDGRMGWTPDGQNVRTYVFYARVEDFVLKNFARIYTLRVPRLLTYAIAHELGHLLLPLAEAHSEKGIMKSQLDGNDLAEVFSGSLSFTAKEGQMMRNEVERRVRLLKMVR